MTEKLYYIDEYMVDCEAEVVSSFIENGKKFVVLNRTCFFPNEGGQSCDKGYIDGKTVLDVTIKNDIIYHEVSELIEEGKIISAKIDWNHRLSNMQMHCAEHIFSGIVAKKFGYNNSGFHLSDNIATMDYDGYISESDLYDIEEEVNKAIYENKNIYAFWPSEEEQKNIEFRSKKNIIKNLRLLCVEDYDICACCAPHPKKTGEIGVFKIKSIQKYKSGVRLSYVAGVRAYKDYKFCEEALLSSCRLISANPNTLAQYILDLKKQNSDLKSMIFDIKEKQLEDIIINRDKNILFVDDIDMSILKNVLGKHSQENIAVFSFIDNSYKYLLCGENANNMQKALANIGAKGGGKENFVQGSIKADKNSIAKELSSYA